MSKTTNKFSPEVRERAVRMVIDHRNDYPSHWAAVVSVSQKIGCALLQERVVIRFEGGTNLTIETRKTTILHSADKIIKHKTGLLNLAEELGNVSKVCQVMGYSRDTFYRYTPCT